VAIAMSLLQNMGNGRKYVLGTFVTPVRNTSMVYFFKLVIVLFWTWILNLICKDGHPEIAWFLVLIPFITIFMVMALAVDKL